MTYLSDNVYRSGHVAAVNVGPGFGWVKFRKCEELLCEVS